MDLEVQRHHRFERRGHQCRVGGGKAGERLAGGAVHDEAPAAGIGAGLVHRRGGQAVFADNGEDGGFAEGHRAVGGVAIELQDVLPIVEGFGHLAGAEQRADLVRHQPSAACRAAAIGVGPLTSW